MARGASILPPHMLKKISVTEATRGMYIHKLEGSWMSHSFWRTKFLIEDEATLEQLRNCGASECWIDVAQGIDVPAAVRVEAVETPPATPVVPAQRRPVGFDAELKQAALI